MLYPLSRRALDSNASNRFSPLHSPSASHPAMQVPSKPMTLDRALPLTRSRLSFPETVSTPNPATTAVNVTPPQVTGSKESTSAMVPLYSITSWPCASRYDSPSSLRAASSSSEAASEPHDV